MYQAKKKRKQRGLDEINLDKESILQLKLQKRYGVQGSLVMRLVGMLNYNGHHIIGHNAFSSAQLDLDLKRRQNKHFHIPKCDYMGTLKMQLNKKEGAKPIGFVEYRNLPDKWEGINKHNHSWYNDNKLGISMICYNNK